MTNKIRALAALALIIVSCNVTALKQSTPKTPSKSSKDAFVIAGAYQALRLNALKSPVIIEKTPLLQNYIQPMKLVFSTKTQKFEPQILSATLSPKIDNN